MSCKRKGLYKSLYFTMVNTCTCVTKYCNIMVFLLFLRKIYVYVNAGIKISCSYVM